MTGFVGRERERALLAARLQDARDGAGRVVLVGGEPGVGKTRLAREAAGIAEGLGMFCAAGRVADDDGSPPLHAVRQVLLAIGAGPEIDGERRGPEDPYRRNAAVLEAIAAAGAARGGLFVLLDDVQWADPGTLRLLVHLARNLAREAVAVVATYRDSEPAPALRDALAALAREPIVDRITLEGLSEAEVGVQLAAVAGFAVPAPVAAAVHRRTRGNPFFVGELGTQLARREVVGEQGLPDGVRDAVRARLNRLGPDARAVAHAAAVLGAGAEPGLLAAVTGIGLPGVLAAVDEARAARILDGRGFTHDLIREAAAAEVPTPERLALHAAAAAALTASGDAARIAHHLGEALPLGDAAAAAGWARRAGDLAAERRAWEEAAQWYGRAVAAGAPERAHVLLARARAQMRAYDIDGARTSLLAAAELAKAAGDGETLAEAVLVMEGVSDFLWDPIGRSLTLDALAALPEGDSGLRARLLAGLVVMDVWRVPGDADGRSLEALGMAERVGDRRAIIEALRARQFACSGPDGAEERLALGGRLLALEPGEDDAAMWGRLWRFDAFAQLGDLHAVAGEAAALAALAEQTSSLLARWHVLRCRAAIAHARGRYAEAVALGEEAVELNRRSGHEGSMLPSVGFLMGVRATIGDFSQEPEKIVLRYLHEAPSWGLRGMLARWMLAAGRVQEARDWYTGLPDIHEVPPFVRLPAAAGLIEMAAAFGELVTVERLYDAMLPHADRFVCGGAGVVVIEGPTQLPLGIGAGALGRHGDAEAHLRAAIAESERAGMPGAAAIARHELARVLLAAGGRGAEAAGLARAAASAAETLGMGPLRAAAAALAGDRPRTALTAREEQIAALVARGLTSRAIARELHLSERTVETHVQHILTKLGVANRTQLATWYTSLRTADT
ncbi:ATP-binding protein [Dactylosporangium sp. CA-139066]|uniref:ATP-binding protein n=1 Tax=Dactylosporangium sp. CA-139066 TaxID=3239930 RepID=UPI003D8E9928